MTQVQRCKICGKVFRKTHECSGHKRKIPCPKCNRLFAESWLPEHLKNGCSIFKPKVHTCGCGQEVARGHGNEESHLNSYAHEKWEKLDIKERRLGVVKGDKGFYRKAGPGEANIHNPNYFRGISKADCKTICPWLANQNEKIKDTEIIYCYCGINCIRTKYTQHCDSKYHVKWVETARQYYEVKSKKTSEETFKRKLRKLKQIEKLAGKRTTPEQSQIGNFVNMKFNTNNRKYRKTE